MERREDEREQKKKYDKDDSGPKGKMVFLYLLFAENDLLIWCGVL
jgi:hypothetical protein